MHILLYLSLSLSVSLSLSPCLSFFLSFPPCFLFIACFLFFLSFTCHTICIYIFTCIILHASNGFTGEILQSSNMPGTGHDGTSCSGIAPDPIFCCYHGSQDDRNATQNTQPLLTKSQMETVPFSHLYQYMNYPVCQREAWPILKSGFLSLPVGIHESHSTLRQGYVGCSWVWMSDAAHRLQAVSLWTPSSLRAGWGDKSCCWCSQWLRIGQGCQCLGEPISLPLPVLNLTRERKLASEGGACKRHTAPAANHHHFVHELPPSRQRMSAGEQ